MTPGPTSRAPAPHTQHALRATDGTRLWVRHWPPATGAPPRAVVLIVHGYLEHSGRYAPLAEQLAGHGIATVGFDLRGHGGSGGPRAYVDDFGAYRADVVDVAMGACPKNVPLVLFGHSLGGLIALDVCVARALQPAALMLSNPYLHHAVAIGRFKRWLGGVMLATWPKARAPAGIDATWLTRNKAAQAALRADPWVLRWASAGWLVATEQAQARLANVRKLDTPVWFGIGTADPMASPGYNQRFYERLLAPDKQLGRYQGAVHELLHDLVSEAFVADVIAFVERLPHH